jgi:hypothetical protein
MRATAPPPPGVRLPILRHDCRLDRLNGRFVGGTDEPVRISLLYHDDEHRGAFDRDDPLAVLPAPVHAGIATMAPHEVARFRVPLRRAVAAQLGLALDEARGQGSHERGVNAVESEQPGAAGAGTGALHFVYVDVLLQDWEPPLPRLPPPRDPAESEREHAEQQRQQYIANPPPSIGTLLAARCSFWCTGRGIPRCRVSS